MIRVTYITFVEIKFYKNLILINDNNDDRRILN